MEALLLLWLALGASGSWVAAQKGRSPGEGFTLGCLLGPIGVLVEAMLPVGLESSEFAPRKTQKDPHEEAARLRRNAELQAEYFRDVATLIQEEKKRLKKERMWSDELLRLERHNLRQAREEARARERAKSASTSQPARAPTASSRRSFEIRQSTPGDRRWYHRGLRSPVNRPHLQVTLENPVNERRGSEKWTSLISTV